MEKCLQVFRLILAQSSRVLLEALDLMLISLSLGRSLAALAGQVSDWDLVRLIVILVLGFAWNNWGFKATMVSSMPPSCCARMAHYSTRAQTNKG